MRISKGVVVLIDDNMFKKLSKFKWCYIRSRKQVVSTANIKNKPTILRMHRLIMGLKCGDRTSVYFLDGNYLNMQKHNLRTTQQTTTSRNKEVYRGIYSYKSSSSETRWYFILKINNKNKYFSGFKTKKSALLARQKLFKKHFGQPYTPFLQSKIARKTFGSLTVINRTNIRQGNKMLWRCRCVCGQYINARTDSLTGGTSTSCGCSRIKTQKGETCKKALYGRYKNSAKRRGIKFRLSFSVFLNLTSKKCFYCRALPNCEINLPGANGNYIYNGIDRYNNKTGYLENNCVPCCTVCNRIKTNKPIKELREHIEKMYKNRRFWSLYSR